MPGEGVSEQMFGHFYQINPRGIVQYAQQKEKQHKASKCCLLYTFGCFCIRLKKLKKVIDNGFQM